MRPKITPYRVASALLILVMAGIAGYTQNWFALALAACLATSEFTRMLLEDRLDRAMHVLSIIAAMGGMQFEIRIPRPGDEISEKTPAAAPLH